MKRCPRCQTEMPDDARVCPECRWVQLTPDALKAVENNEKMGKVILVMLIIAALFLAFVFFNP